MNKKGFTLVELLTVIAILGILSIIAVPNVVSIINNNKNDVMLSDAQKLISLAKYQININSTLRESASHRFDYNDLNTKGDIAKDPDGGNYNSSLSYVLYSKSDTTVSYCVVLIGSKRSIGATSCVDENSLFSRNIVQENEE